MLIPMLVQEARAPPGALVLVLAPRPHQMLVLGVLCCHLLSPLAPLAWLELFLRLWWQIAHLRAWHLQLGT